MKTLAFITICLMAIASGIIAIIKVDRLHTVLLVLYITNAVIGIFGLCYLLWNRITEV